MVVKLAICYLLRQLEGILEIKIKISFRNSFTWVSVPETPGINHSLELQHGKDPKYNWNGMGRNGSNNGLTALYLTEYGLNL